MKEINLSAQLKINIKDNGVVWFLGHELSVLAGLPSWEDLAKDLASKCEISESQDPYEIMEYYETILDRPTLYEFIARNFSTKNITPTKLHIALAHLPVNIIFTTAIDDLLEKAFEESGKDLKIINSRTDLPFWNKESSTVLIKLFGDINRPNTLTLTRKDLNIYFHKNKQLSDQLRMLFMRKTFLFMGYDLQTREFRSLFDCLSYDMQDLKRKSFILTFAASEVQKTNLTNFNAEVITLPGESREDKVNTLTNFLKRLPLDKEEKVIKSNPTPLLPKQRISDEVRGLLKTMGHMFEEIGAEEEFCFIARRKTNGTILSRLYKCFDGVIGIVQVEEIQRILDNNKDVGTAWLITYSDGLIPPTVRRILKSIPRIKAFSLARFYHNMIDFTEYLNMLIEDYNKSHISDYYVSLSCSVPQYDRHNRIIIERDEYDNIDTYINAWFDLPTQNHISILGEFGSGKTWYCKYLAATLAKRYLDQPNFNRIPILVPLGKFKTISNIEDLITTVLINEYGLDLPGGFGTFQHLNHFDHLLLIFDGLDEMSSLIDYSVVVSNFEEISKVIEKGTKSKAILTCRTSYFRSNLEERSLLVGDGDDLIDLKNRPNFDIVHIRGLSQVKIKDAIKKRKPDYWEDTYKTIDDIYDLSNLASRPVFLKMILASIDELKNLKSVKVIDIYDSYVKSWMKQQEEQKRSLIPRDKKLCILEDLAWDLYTRGGAAIPYSELSESIERILNLNEESSGYYAYDIQAQSLLNRDGIGNYTFSHQSFIDYFVASKLSKDIVLGNYELFGKEYISDEVFYFMNEMMENNENKAKLLIWISDNSAPITVRRNCMMFLSNQMEDKCVRSRLREVFKDENELSIAIRIAVAFHKAGEDALIMHVCEKILTYDTTSKIKKSKALTHSLSLQRGQDLSIKNQDVLSKLSQSLFEMKNEHIKRTIILVLGRSNYKDAKESLFFILNSTKDLRTLRYALTALTTIGDKDAIEKIIPFTKNDNPIIRNDAERIINLLKNL